VIDAILFVLAVDYLTIQTLLLPLLYPQWLRAVLLPGLVD
jgi:hypothetical protein